MAAASQQAKQAMMVLFEDLGALSCSNVLSLPGLHILSLNVVGDGLSLVSLRAALETR
jgi:hypothetical protein